MPRRFSQSTAIVCSIFALGLALTASAMGPGHPKRHHAPRNLLSFGTMYGVDGPFVGDANPIRGVPGDESPWGIKSVIGSLDTEGHLLIVVRGLVFTDNPDPSLIGKNDEDEFRGLVSCLTEVGEDSVQDANVMTEGFPATPSGNSVIHAKVELPNPCVAPIVFVLAGSENKWFAVTGFEEEEDDGGEN